MKMMQGACFFAVSNMSRTRAAMAADRVDLVDEDDAGGVLLRLLEHVAHAARTDADEHLDEVGTGNGEERHVRLAGDGAGEQRLAGAGRTSKQYAAWNSTAKAVKLSGVAQVLDNVLEILRGFANAGNIVKCGSAGCRLQFCTRCAKTDRALVTSQSRRSDMEKCKRGEYENNQRADQQACE